LNESKQKEKLEEIATSSALPESGKNDELFKRISDQRQFEQQPELKMRGFFSPHASKRARVADVPTAGPS